MKVEIWSDVRCPWCLIGKRRFERALAQCDDLPVELVFRSFELDPAQTPLPEGKDFADVLAQKYRMPRARAEAMMDHVAQTAAAEGLSFQFAAQPRESGSFDAHRLLQLARSKGEATQVALKERLMQGWFCEGRSIRDPASLVAMAVEAGLSADEAGSVLQDPTAWAEAVRADEAEARAFGITGVPFFVFDRKLGVSGAQPTEVFVQALRKAAPAPAATTCDDDACGFDEA